MAWIESHQELRGHPKTRKAARMLGVNVPTTIGHLHCLWYWALDYAQDGDLTGYDAEEISDAAGWEGDPELILRALIDCGTAGRPGFIEDKDGRRLLHHWDDYAGAYLNSREGFALANSGRRAEAEARVRETILLLQARGERLTLRTVSAEARCSKGTASRVLSRMREESTPSGTDGIDRCGTSGTGYGTGEDRKTVQASSGTGEQYLTVPDPTVPDQTVPSSTPPLPPQPAPGASPVVAVPSALPATGPGTDPEPGTAVPAADGAGAPPAPEPEPARSRKPRTAGDPEAQALAKAIYDALAVNDELRPPTGSAWFGKALGRIKTLTTDARRDLLAASEWAAGPNPPGYLRAWLIDCNWPQIISAFRAYRARDAPPGDSLTQPPKGERGKAIPGRGEASDRANIWDRSIFQPG